MRYYITVVETAMNILLISASPRKERSRTLALAREAVRGMGGGAKVEIVHLRDLRIEFCRHCESCHKTCLRCPIQDDVRVLLEKMLAADGILLATPNYINQVTASLKALFDRSAHFIHCKRLLGRYVCGVVTSGGGREDQVVLDYLRHYAHVCGAQYSGGVSSRGPAPDEKRAEAFRLGQAFARDIRDKKRYPGQIRIIEKGKDYFREIIRLRKDD